MGTAMGNIMGMLGNGTPAAGAAMGAFGNQGLASNMGNEAAGQANVSQPFSISPEAYNAMGKMGIDLLKAQEAKRNAVQQMIQAAPMMQRSSPQQMMSQLYSLPAQQRSQMVLPMLQNMRGLLG